MGKGSQKEGNEGGAWEEAKWASGAPFSGGGSISELLAGGWAPPSFRVEGDSCGQRKSSGRGGWCLSWEAAGAPGAKLCTKVPRCAGGGYVFFCSLVVLQIFFMKHIHLRCGLSKRRQAVNVKYTGFQRCNARKL